MKMIVEVGEDYPVLFLKQERESNPHGQPIGGQEAAYRGRRERELRPERTVDSDQGLFRRYEAAREEWVEVQKLLQERYADTVTGSDAEGVDPQFRAILRRNRRMVDRNPSSEWVSADQARRWATR